MEYVKLGKTDERVSRIGLGAWQFSDAWGLTDFERAKAVIARAHELEVNLIDTAMVYGRGMSERFVGQALKDLNIKRDEVFIVTKVPGEYLSRDDVIRAARGSLKRLQVTHLDALLAHWPPAWHNIPTCEYARAFELLIDRGLVRYVGLSNFPVALVEEFRSCMSRHDVEIFELRYNIVERKAEEEHLPYAEANRVTVLAWSPLAQGAVLGKYTLEDVAKLQDVRRNNVLFRPHNYEQIARLVEAMKGVAQARGKTLAQVALNFIVTTSPVVVPIPGAKTPEQVEENVGAIGWSLTFDEWSKLDEISRSLRISYVDIPE